MVNRSHTANRDHFEAIAVQALGFIAADPERLGRFLAQTGIGPHRIRDAARDPSFLAGVLDHLAGDEKLLLAFAADAGLTPEQVAQAHAALNGDRFERS